jgi:cation diffusion facilitator family transporter
VAGSSKKVIYAALVGNALIAVTKFVAAAYTGSSAMLSEGIHSVVDTGNQVLLLYGLRRAKQPPSREFPFGHGKEIYFWSFVVAILIFAVGAGISTYEGIKHVLEPSTAENPTINYIVLGLAMLFEGVAWTIAWKEFRVTKGDLGYFEAVRRGKDPTMFVVLFEDSAAMLGLVAAFIGIFLAQVTGNPLFDGLASIVIGIILGGTAVWLAIETKGLLIGEAASRDIVEGIRELAAADPSVNKVNEVLTMHMGPEFILTNISVDFRDGLESGQIERAVARLDRSIKARFGIVKRIFIEAESADSKASWLPDSTSSAEQPEQATDSRSE